MVGINGSAVTKQDIFAFYVDVLKYGGTARNTTYHIHRGQGKADCIQCHTSIIVLRIY